MASICFYYLIIGIITDIKIILCDENVNVFPFLYAYFLDNCETLRKRESNYGKLTRAKENTGEPPVLRRQERLLVVTGFLVPLRVTRSGSVFSLILLTFRNIHNVKLSFAIA